MSRTFLDLPQEFLYTTEVMVRVSDLNYADHLSHVAILDLIQEARQRFLKEHGFTELDVGGVGLIVTDAVVVYRSEAHHGDVLAVDLALADLQRKSLDTLYRLTSRATGEEVARAKVGFVYFDYDKRCVVEAPARFRAAFYPD
jgi:acyl-CoA thioesterase FadM